jgi:predicted ribosomally synthesized peptide with nif11-like leader
MSKVNLERFLELASQDAQMKSRLKLAPNQSAFVELLVGLGKQKGFDFTAADVKGALAGVASPSAELSDAELEAVAGGSGDGGDPAQMLAGMSYVPGAC